MIERSRPSLYCWIASCASAGPVAIISDRRRNATPCHPAAEFAEPPANYCPDRATHKGAGLPVIVNRCEHRIGRSRDRAGQELRTGRAPSPSVQRATTTYEPILPNEFRKGLNRFSKIMLPK